MLFYECKITYDKRVGEDNPAKVTETYLVEGINPTDCESRLINELKPYLFGEYVVTQMKKVQYFDLFTEEGNTIYKGVVEMITVDEDKETRKKVNFLVSENSIHDALAKLAGNIACYDIEIVEISKSPILEIYRATK